MSWKALDLILRKPTRRSFLRGLAVTLIAPAMRISVDLLEPEFEPLKEVGAVRRAHIWTGCEDGNWENPANWSDGVVPSSPVADLILVGGHMMEVPEGAEIGTLTISGGGAVNMGGLERPWYDEDFLEAMHASS